MILAVCSAWEPLPTSRSIRAWACQDRQRRLTHFLVIVLTGMDKEVLDLLGIFIHGLDDRGHFHKIRPGADDIQNFHRDSLARLKEYDFTCLQ